LTPKKVFISVALTLEQTVRRSVSEGFAPANCGSEISLEKLGLD
jgi:hypothetical protein